MNKQHLIAHIAIKTINAFQQVKKLQTAWRQQQNAVNYNFLRVYGNKGNHFSFYFIFCACPWETYDKRLLYLFSSHTSNYKAFHAVFFLENLSNQWRCHEAAPCKIDTDNRMEAAHRWWDVTEARQGILMNGRLKRGIIKLCKGFNSAPNSWHYWSSWPIKRNNVPFSIIKVPTLPFLYILLNRTV